MPSRLDGLRAGVPLAPHTTLGLGGPARHFLEAEDEARVLEAHAWAGVRGVPMRVLGGGSNLVVSDAGVEALVLAVRTRGVQIEREAERALVTAAAGEPWDALVARTVAADLAGLECLSGIPGFVGATPIENVGAYGQEVSDTLVAARVLDRRSGTIERLDAAAFAFGYRDSALKRDPDRAVVLDVTFALRPGGAPTLRYAELTRALERGGDGATGGPPSLASTRATVLALRRQKSMVLDPSDPNARSAGSFFTNPIVSASLAAQVVTRALADGTAAHERDVPRWAQDDGRVKLAAGWLIERAGVSRGERRGAVGVSSAHALALVHHGGGSTRELLELADDVTARVASRWGVTLEREPVVW